MRLLNGLVIIIFFMLIWNSCTIYDKEFDNPVDYKANEEKGIRTPSLVFYPKNQMVNLGDSILIGSYIVFKGDSVESFSGIQMRINFPDNFMELDTIIPGQLITDSLQSVPLFVYTYDNENILDIYAYFLDTVRLDVNETGHLADLIFKPLESGSDSIYYDLNECTILNYQDSLVNINGTRSAEIIIR